MKQSRFYILFVIGLVSIALFTNSALFAGEKNRKPASLTSSPELKNARIQPPGWQTDQGHFKLKEPDSNQKMPWHLVQPDDVEFFKGSPNSLINDTGVIDPSWNKTLPVLDYRFR